MQATGELLSSTRLFSELMLKISVANFGPNGKNFGMYEGCSSIIRTEAAEAK